MVSGTTAASPVAGHMFSTVVPANVTGDTLLELTGLDLALKLHYLRTVYYFKASETVEGLGIWKLKEPMFLMLDVYPKAAGRIRRHESGWPHVKCNDSGVRIVEARCEGMTMEEWLREVEVDREKHLVYNKPLGPDIFFSPLVYLQFTKFKCGGLAVGVSWAHVLGDAVSESNSINLWGHILESRQPPTAGQQQQIPQGRTTSSVVGKPLSVKKVEPVGDLWQTHTKTQMATFSFQISESKLKHLQSKISGKHQPFEAISALLWQSLAKIRAGKEPNVVTIIRNDTSEERKQVIGNTQTISTASTDSLVAKLDLSELATLISNSNKDERQAIQEMTEREDGKEDFIVYGANLTFVDMQNVELYKLELKGQRPAQVDYSVDGVGEEGAVLVLPSPDDNAGTGGRSVSVILPEDEIPKLKEALASERITA